MTTLDSTLRAAADRLRNAAESTTDVEAGLRAVTARSGTTTAPRSPRRIRRRAWWGAGAALTTGIASIVAVAVVRDTPSSQVVPAASTTAPSTGPSSTSTSPETDSPTTAVPAATTISVSYLDPPPLYDPSLHGRLQLTLPMSGGETQSFAVGPTDRRWVNVVDGTSAQLLGARADAPWDWEWLANVPLPVGPLFAPVLGPDDVLYGLWHAPDSGVAELDAVAIPLTGPDQGKVVASVRHNATPFGDLPAYALGLGATGVVDRDGRIDGNVIDYVGGATVDVPVGVPDAGWPLDIQRDPAWGVEMDNDLIVAGPDGAVFATTIGPDGTQPVIASLHPDGTGTWWSLPEGWHLVASDVGGTLIAGPFRDGDLLGVAWFRPVDSSWPTELTIDPASLALLDIPCGATYCAPLATSDGGFLTLDGTTITKYNAAGEAKAIVEVVGLENPSLVTIGPADDIAYLRVSAGTPDPIDLVVAVALVGPDTGRVVATSDGIDGSGDSSLVATARGIVETGDVGPEPRPSDIDPIVLPWLDASGAVVAHPGPFITYDPMTQILRIVSAQGSEMEWSLPPAGGFDRGVPAVEPTAAGLLVWRWSWVAGEPSLQLLTSDGAILAVNLPDGYEFAGFHDGMLLLWDGEDLWLAVVPAP